MDGDLLEMRAAAATVAEPDISKKEEIALSALRLHGHIMEQVRKTKDRKSEAFKTLRQALGYTLSVVVHAVPREGFEFMAQLIHWQDADVLWVVKQNLKKSRLVKNFPQEVEWIKELLLLQHP